MSSTWYKTAPNPLSEASDSRMNSLVKSGYPNTSALVKIILVNQKPSGIQMPRQMRVLSNQIFSFSNVVTSFFTFLLFIFLTLVGPTN